MEKEEILDMLYDFADWLGGTNFKEIKGKFDNITIKAKIENGDDIYLEYCDYDGADPYIGVTFGNKSGLQDCAFNPRLDVSNEVSRLLGNYFANRKHGLTQSDLEAIGNINLNALREAIDVWF